ncbi:MAG TPA: hypothetical protein VGD24_05845, partial [Gallionella sp.]
MKTVPDLIAAPRSVSVRPDVRPRARMALAQPFLFAGALLSVPLADAGEMGRLFFTPEQRTQ